MGSRSRISALWGHHNRLDCQPRPCLNQPLHLRPRVYRRHIPFPALFTRRHIDIDRPASRRSSHTVKLARAFHVQRNAVALFIPDAKRELRFFRSATRLLRQRLNLCVRRARAQVYSGIVGGGRAGSEREGGEEEGDSQYRSAGDG